MKTKTRLCLCLAFLWLYGTPHAFAGLEGKAVFVNLNMIFNDYYKTKSADERLKEQASDFNAERKKLVSQYTQIEDEFKSLREDAQNNAFSDEVRNERRNAAEEKLVEMRERKSKIGRFDESRRKQLEDQSRRMRKTILEDITKVIESYARSEGHMAVLDSSGQSLNGIESVLYLDKRYDITSEILNILNQEE